jgi:replicative superfamily II helicase
MTADFEKKFRSAIIGQDLATQFRLLANLAGEIQADLREPAVDTIEKCVRIAGARHELGVSDGIDELIDQILLSVGLYPYLGDRQEDWRRTGFKALYRDPTNQEFVYHEEQSRALNLFLSGSDALLSAPTSFGKSSLIDALITVRKQQRVAIVVPTLALLDEVKRRVQARFGGEYLVISHPQHLDEVEDDDQVIVVTTQERLLSLASNFEFDLVIIDEFYKMDTSPEGKHQLPNKRAAALNRVFARFGTSAKQVLLLGPNLEALDEITVRHRSFKKYVTKFRPVAVNLYDRTNAKDPLAETKRILDKFGSESTLIYCASPKSANTLAGEIANLSSAGEKASKFSEWIASSVHPEWDVAKSLSSGVGIHHGRIPRSISGYQVKLFDEGELPVLICTSTLIEGVNTAAKNIIIYDKSIDGTKGLNKFEIENIKGRAGRLRRHFVGNVFVLREPKRPKAYEPDLPLLDQD